jgi:hypothetical protein
MGRAEAPRPQGKDPNRSGKEEELTRRRLRKIVAREMGRKSVGRERHRERRRERRRRGSKVAFLLGAGAGVLAARAYLERPIPGAGG